jgi:hypothetical protein
MTFSEGELQVGCVMFAMLQELADHYPRFSLSFALYVEMFEKSLIEADLKTKSGKQVGALNDARRCTQRSSHVRRTFPEGAPNVP